MKLLTTWASRIFLFLPVILFNACAGHRAKETVLPLLHPDRTIPWIESSTEDAPSAVAATLYPSDGGYLLLDNLAGNYFSLQIPCAHCSTLLQDGQKAIRSDSLVLQLQVVPFSDFMKATPTASREEILNRYHNYELDFLQRSRHWNSRKVYRPYPYLNIKAQSLEWSVAASQEPDAFRRVYSARVLEHERLLVLSIALHHRADFPTARALLEKIQLSLHEANVPMTLPKSETKVTEAPKIPSLPLSALTPTEKSSRPPAENCVWKALESQALGIRVLVQDCSTVNSYVYSVNGDKLEQHRPADDRIFGDHTLLEVFSKPKQQTLPDAIRERFIQNLNSIAREDCQVKKIMVGNPPRPAFTIVPTGKYEKLILADLQNGPRDMGCGPYGKDQSLTYFEAHPQESETRYVFVRFGWDETPNFDENSIRFTSQR